MELSVSSERSGLDLDGGQREKEGEQGAMRHAAAWSTFDRAAKYANGSVLRMTRDKDAQHYDSLTSVVRAERSEAEWSEDGAKSKIERQQQTERLAVTACAQIARLQGTFDCAPTTPGSTNFDLDHPAAQPSRNSEILRPAGRGWSS